MAISKTRKWFLLIFVCMGECLERPPLMWLSWTAHPSPWKDSSTLGCCSRCSRHSTRPRQRPKGRGRRRWGGRGPTKHAAQSHFPPPPQYGFVFGIVNLAAFFFAPVLGRYGDAIGPKLLYNTGSLTQGIGSICFGLLKFVNSTGAFIGLSYLLRCACTGMYVVRIQRVQ